ncbi:MAG: hypothetical protein Q8R40_00875 [bacterium]|nr:hypothetical protein [bacterium]
MMSSREITPFLKTTSAILPQALMANDRGEDGEGRFVQNEPASVPQEQKRE